MFELLDTTGCHYLYDAVENQIVPISEEDAGKLSAYIKGDRTPEATECVERYQSMGLCTDKAVEELENPMNELAPYYLNERLENLILQVTQQCNLRCSYCVYSGKYINRTHNNSVMPYETACRAVDFFMARNLLVEKPSMGFYGGEPLLQFGLIKRIVGYVKENYPGREIQFNMTVNGTLLTDEVVDFLAENDFSLTLSIDGPKEIHDANRRFVSGQGSFDLIMEKLKYIREKYPDYFKKIMTNTVLSPDCDYEKALTFFEEQEYIRELHPRLGLVSPSGIKDANRVAYTGKWRELKDKNRAEVLYELSGGECCGEEDKKAYKILADYRDEIKRYHKSLKSGRLYLKKNHPSGLCVAGARRLFVTVDGDFYPCEKLPEIDELKIGTAEEGFDMEKVQNLMNIGKLTEERCKGCWAFQFCSLCAAACLTEEGISGDYREYACGDVRRHAKDMLRDVCILMESGYDFQEAGEDEDISSV